MIIAAAGAIIMPLTACSVFSGWSELAGGTCLHCPDATSDRTVHVPDVVIVEAGPPIDRAVPDTGFQSPDDRIPCGNRSCLLGKYCCTDGTYSDCTDTCGVGMTWIGCTATNCGPGQKCCAQKSSNVWYSSCEIGCGLPVCDPEGAPCPPGQTCEEITGASGLYYCSE